MTVQASEVQNLLKQANPASPDAPSPQEAAEIQQNAPLSPQVQAGQDALANRRANPALTARSAASDTNAAPSPGSFHQKLADAAAMLFPKLGASAGMAPMMLAGVKAM